AARPNANYHVARVVPRSASFSHRGEVLSQYLQTMEQFLDTQSDVMAAYLARRNRFVSFEAERGHLPCSPQPMVPEGPTNLPVLPMIGEIVHHEPGHEIVMRRQLDLAEDRFATHHTVGGRSVSKVDPNQYGLPVMPMTFSLEIAAEVATLLVPGQV